MKLDQLPKWAVPAAASVVSFGVGAAVGYFLTKHQYDQIEENLEKLEVDQLEFDFKLSEFTHSLDRAQGIMTKMINQGEALTSHIRDLAVLKDLPVAPSISPNHPSQHRPKPPVNYRGEVGPDPRQVEEDPSEGIEEEDNVVHVFAAQNVDPNWDYEAELQNRDPQHPYVIHRDEFFNDEFGIQEISSPQTYTYYKGDQVLVDERDVPIPDAEERVGPLLFGHGSGDSAIFYVRNERLSEEYEIVEDDGYYQVTVLGEEIEAEAEREDLRHARRAARMRLGDE